MGIHRGSIDITLSDQEISKRNIKSQVFVETIITFYNLSHPQFKVRKFQMETKAAKIIGIKQFLMMYVYKLVEQCNRH